MVADPQTKHTAANGKPNGRNHPDAGRGCKPLDRKSLMQDGTGA